MIQVVKINNMSLTPVAIAKYDSILDRLYNRINLMNHRYQMMTEKSHIEEVREMMVCPHVHGFNYIMFFTIIDGHFYNLLISKKELRFYRNQNKNEEIKIYRFWADIANISIYYDTIFDGKIIKNGTYIIYDSYTMCEKDVTKIDIIKKYSMIKSILVDLNRNNPIKIDLSRIYPSQELLKMVDECDTYKMNGVVFIPRQSGKWYLYVSENELNDYKKGITVVKTENTVNESQREFIMKKTDVPDVYELYWEQGMVREGIAAIPNLKTSHYCRELFRSRQSHKILCIKSNKFNKWIPICQDISELSQVIF